MKTFLFSIALLGGIAPLAQAQSVSSEYRTNGRKTLEVFEKQRQVLQDHSAVIYRGHKRMVYGVIMSSDGYILTKASELEPGEPKKSEETGLIMPIKELSVRIGENVLYKKVKVVAVDTASDVALIKIDATDLKPVVFADNSNVIEGRWVVTNGASSRYHRRVRVGIISANTRKIDGPSPVTIGVMLEEEKDKLLIAGVVKGLGAEKAGMKKGDILVSINGQKLTTVTALRDYVFGLDPDEILKVSILRAGKAIQLGVKLTKRPKPQMPQRMGKNDSMSGQFSLRRDGFSRVLQTDIPLARHSCGGPLLTLDGKCIGMTIARANRAETFVTPLEELKKIYKKLKNRK